jgi:hypothetical protein
MTVQFIFVVFLISLVGKERLTRNCKCCLCWSFLALFAFGGGVIAVVLLQQYWGSSHHYRVRFHMITLYCVTIFPCVYVYGMQDNSRV